MLNLNILRVLALPSTSLTATDGALQLHFEDVLCNDGKAERQAPRTNSMTYVPLRKRPRSASASASL